MPITNINNAASQNTRPIRVSVDVRKGGFDLESIYPRDIRDKLIGKFEERATTATNNLVAEQEKSTALATLSKLSFNLQKSLKSLAMNGSANDAYSHKQLAAISTNDIGAGSDYANVTVTDSACIGQTAVKVIQTATTAYTIYGNSETGQSLEAKCLLSAIKIKTGGNQQEIALDPDDKNLDCFNKIIDYGKRSGKFNAYISKIESLSNQEAERGILIVKAPKTGNVGMELNFFTLNSGDQPQELSNDIVEFVGGQDAEIKVDGIVKKGSSNIFRDVIPGITIEAKKVNSNGAALTVNIKQNVEQIVDSIIEFTTAFNQLSEFVDIHSQYVRKNGGLVPSDEAKLSMTNSLNEAQKLLSSVTQVVSGTSKKVLWLETIGIKNVGSKDGTDLLTNKSPAKLAITDQQKLFNICNNEPEILKQLFVGRAEVKNAQHTSGVLSFYNFDKDVLISEKVIGKNIKIVDNGQGAIEYFVNGGFPQTARYNGSSLLTFEGDLKGLTMYYNPGAIGIRQEFDIENLAQGLAHKNIIQIDRLNRQIESDSKLFETKTKTLQGIETKAQAALKGTQEKIDGSMRNLERSVRRFNDFSDRMDNWSKLINSD